MSENINAALLLIDLQDRFCGYNENTYKAARLCAEFAEKVRDHMPVMHAAYIRSSFSATRVQRGIQFQNDRQKQFFDCDFHRFHYALPHPRDFVFLKATDDLLQSNKYILPLLRHKQISHVYVAGVNTSACVLDTAKSLRRAGFDVTILEDLCGDNSGTRHLAEEKLAKASEKLGIHRSVSARLIPRI